MPYGYSLPATFRPVGEIFENAVHGLAAWRAARDNVADQVVDVLLLGDSITCGYDATNRDTLSFYGLLQSSVQSLYGNAGIGMRGTNQRTPLTPAIVYGGAGWLVPNPIEGPYNCVRYNTGAGNTVTLAGVTCTKFEIFCVEDTETAAFAVSIDGGGDVSAGGSSATKVHRAYQVDAGALAAHTIVLKCPGGGKYLKFRGIASLRGVNGVRVHNQATDGSVIADTTVPATQMDWLPSLAPDLTIIMATVNDFNNQTALATYRTNLTTAVVAARTCGSVLLVAGPYRDLAPAIPQSDYHTVMREVARVNQCAYFDVGGRLGGSHAVHDLLGVLSGGVHPNNYGHSFLACELLRALRQ